MKETEEIQSCDIELFSETLAVVLSECRRDQSREERVKSPSHRSGKNLFRTFVKENSSSVWKPTLVDSILAVRFIGFFRDPPTLLLQADSSKLQHIRDAWSNRLLRAPPRFHIDFVGDVTSIGARPLSRGRFIPLCDAVCISIGNVESQNQIATQEAILGELDRAFPPVHSPSRELLHETLGKLIRERKVFCTGPGYHLVTESTYSGKVRDENTEETHSSPSKTNEVQDCQACQRNRAAFSSRVAERRSFRVKRGRGKQIPEDVRSPEKSQIEIEPLHGSVVHSSESGSSHRPRSPRRSMDQENEIRKSNNGFVEKVANKIFRRRNKSGSDRRNSEASRQASVDSKEDRQSGVKHQVRELSPKSARRLGYVINSDNQDLKTSIRARDRSSSESPVKQIVNEEIKNSGHRRSRKSDKQQLYVSTSHRCRVSSQAEFQSISRAVGTQIEKKDKSPSKRATRCKSPLSGGYHQDPVARLRETSRHYQNPRVRDAAVNCNLEEEEIEKKQQERKGQRSSRRMISAEDVGHKEQRTSESQRSLRRSKSLRLPRERPYEAYGTTPRGDPPKYSGFHSTESRNSLSYLTSSRRSATPQWKRQSMSSASSGRDYSYLHACHFAPSIRVGSVIADHLEELERRRLLLEGRSFHRDFSSESSTLSSLTSNQMTSGQSWEETEEETQEEVADDFVEKDATNTIDEETAAALEIAKRLAKLDIKMTRQEWTDYFSNKILPSHVEQSLLQSEEKTEERFESPTSFFENTSGSVETVIDLNHDETRKSNSPRENEEAAKIRRENSPYGSFEQKRRSEGDDAFFQLKGTNRENASLKEKRTHERSSRFSKGNSPRDVDSHGKIPGKTSSYRSEHDLQRELNLKSHNYVPYCHAHRQIFTTANDTASLTEDSGFHSSRERNSLSSWDASKKTSETSV